MRSDRVQAGVGWFLLAVVVGVTDVYGGPQELIRIDAADPVRLLRLEHSAAPPVRIVDGYALAWCDAERLDEVRSLGFTVTSLGPRRNEMDYAVVFVDRREDGSVSPSLDSIGRVLDQNPRTLILVYPPKNRESLWSTYETLPILDRPILFPVKSRDRAVRAPPEADAAIAAWVDAVDIKHLRAVCQTLQDFGTRESSTGGCRNAGHYLEGLFTGYGLTDVSTFDYSPSYFCDNIVAVQEGERSPEEVYVIGAHYDSRSNSAIAPGADDNASGTATVMEAARLLAPHRFEATIIYVAFGGEEQGLIGSEAWAAWARAEGVDIRGMINVDMIGYLPHGLVGDLDLIVDPFDPTMRDLAFSIVPLYLPDYLLRAGGLTQGSSDHESFWQNGFRALALHEDTRYSNPNLHRSTDRIGPSLNDFEFMKKNVQSGVALLATLARPARVRITHTPIEDPPSDAEAYPITARLQSDTPLWEDSLLVRYRIDKARFESVRLEAIGDSGMYQALIPRQAPGSLVEYEIFARDIEGRSSHHPLRAPQELHRFVVGLVTLYEDRFDENNGWTVGAPTDDATSGIWEWGDPVGTGAQPEEDADPDPGLNCYFTGNGSPGGDIGESDVDGGRTSLTSPRFDPSGAVRLQIGYTRWFVDETFPDDTLTTYISNDDGESWILLEAYGTSERVWRRAEIDSVEQLLPLTDAMRLRFVAEDVGSASLVEAAIDKIKLAAVYPADDIRTPARSGLTSAWPLPFRSEITLGYDLLEEANVKLTIYDIRGRRVVEIVPEAQTPGSRTAEWNGKDASGETVPSGVYFVRLDVGGRWAGNLRIPKVR